MSGDATENPLTELLKGALSEYDFGVLEHGFAPHGRDYGFVIQDSLCNDPGTYELSFTHGKDSCSCRARHEHESLPWVTLHWVAAYQFIQHLPREKQAAEMTLYGKYSQGLDDWIYVFSCPSTGTIATARGL
jgi:hypothetical protein